MAKIKWHIGCSGFYYKEWKGKFYPNKLPQRDWFHYYAQHFDTLELNVTFYRFPTLQLLQNFYNKAPDGFSFSVKVPRLITHFKKFEQTEGMLNNFYELLKKGLKEKLSCVLFQLPPIFRFSEEHLLRIIHQLDLSFHNVIEFRHESWWRKDVQATLKKNNTSFCGVSFPKIPFDDTVINTSLCYYRFHGVPRLYVSKYTHAFIEKIYTQINIDKKVRQAYIYFDNTTTVAALQNAHYFQKLVK